MSHLVIGNTASFLGAKHATLLLKAGDDALDSCCKVIEGNCIAVPPCRNDGRLVD
jgi:hypothetical protein